MKNDPDKNGMTYASHTLPSLHLFTPHQLTAPPNTNCMPITSSSSTQSTKFHITVSITQQLHHMHKYNNSKSLFSHNCNGSIITKQQSKITTVVLVNFAKERKKRIAKSKKRQGMNHLKHSLISFKIMRK